MRATLVLVVSLFLLPALASALDDRGIDPDVSNVFGDGVARECAVYFYQDPMTESGRVGGLGFDVTVGGDLSYANISNYDVLFLPLVAPGAITDYHDDIEMFVGGGGGLYIHQVNVVGTIDYAPPGFEADIDNNFWCLPPEANTIVNPGHPAMSGLVDADLPGRFDGVPVAGLGEGYVLLATGTGTCVDDMHCAAGCYGEGHVFFDCSCIGANSSIPGSDAYVVCVFNWLCEEAPSPAESTSWGQLKSIFQ